MRIVPSLTATLALVCLACGSTRPAAVTTGEIIEILGIQAWRLTLPGDGSKQWTIDVEQVAAPPRLGAPASKILRFKAQALVALRPESDDSYRFTLIQNNGASSGSSRLCSEPAGSVSFCGAYGIEFESEPRCLGDCSRVLLATLTPMLGESVTKILVARLAPALSITPAEGDVVVPLH